MPTAFGLTALAVQALPAEKFVGWVKSKRLIGCSTHPITGSKRQRCYVGGVHRTDAQRHVTLITLALYKRAESEDPNFFRGCDTAFTLWRVSSPLDARGGALYGYGTRAA